MRRPRLSTMTDLPLGIGLLAAIIAVAVWLVHFHLIETMIVYGISFFVGFLLAIRWAYVHWRNKLKNKP